MLDDKGIDSIVEITNNSVRNYGSGSFISNDRFYGLDSCSNEYRIFVHSRDYEKASAALRGVSICRGEIK